MNQNNDSNSERMAGVSVRTNGQSYGATAESHHVAESSGPLVRAGRMDSSVNVYRHFDETDVGDVSNVQPFADTYEIHAAMRDPRYNRSKGYRMEVTRRLAASLNR